MNKQGRAQLYKAQAVVQSLLENTDWEEFFATKSREDIVARFALMAKQLEGVSAEVGNLATDERDKFDNLSESLQESDKGQALEACADNLDQLVSKLDGWVYTLKNERETKDLTASDIESALEDLASAFDNVEE